MFKKIAFALSLPIVFILPAAADLKVDIVAGDLVPIPIAVQEFEAPAGGLAAKAAELRDVVVHDLASTGLFRMIDKEAYPKKVVMDEVPPFTDWAMIKAQVLVQAKLSETKDGKYDVKYYVWDVAGHEQIEAQSLQAAAKTARRLAHVMADGIYERLTGEPGYFDTQIIFIAETGEVDARNKRMAIMDSDGFGFRYISDNKTFVMNPHFSPNMQTVVFLSYRDEDPMVWILDMDTGKQRRLGRFGGMTFAPRFSPDGGRIALTLAKDGMINLYEYDIEEKSLRQLTFGEAIDTSPSYSPDGKKLAFNSNRSGSQQLHVLDMETFQETRLSYGSGRYATPAWSPRGDYIAFTKIADNTFYIGIMTPSGKGEKILASGWFMEAPSWAPGGRRLVYYETEKLGETERASKIRSVDIMGQNDYDFKLPDGVHGVEPTWSPSLP
jgi:TolB protein